MEAVTTETSTAEVSSVGFTELSVSEGDRILAEAKQHILYVIGESFFKTFCSSQRYGWPGTPTMRFVFVFFSGDALNVYCFPVIITLGIIGNILSFLVRLSATQQQNTCLESHVIQFSHCHGSVSHFHMCTHFKHR